MPDWERSLTMKHFVAVAVLAVGAALVSAEEVSTTPGINTQLTATDILAQPKPKYDFFASRTNRMLASGEVTTRFLDALSTRQALTNPCKCILEEGSLFGISLEPVAKSGWAYPYALGMASSNILASRMLWNYARTSRHPKLFHFAARAFLAFDISTNAYKGPANNWANLHRLGK